MYTFIADLSAILALCGIISVRNFIPVFVFALGKRLAPTWAGCPSALQDLFARAPDWLSSDFALVVLGILAVIELLANWNDTAREVMDEANWDKYAKPIFAFLVTYSLVSADQAATLDFVLHPIAEEAGSSPAAALPVVTNSVAVAASTASVAQSSTAVSGGTGLPAFLSAIVAFFAAAFTLVLAKVRGNVASFLRGIDPDNSLKLHTIAALAEETTWVALAVCAIFLPILALLFLALSLLFEQALKAFSSRLVEWLLREPRNLDDPAVRLAYRRRLIRYHRCPDCHVALGKDHLCGTCGKNVWTEAFSRRDFVREQDRRCVIILCFSLLLSALPILGYAFGSAALSLAVISPIRRFLGKGDNLVGSCLFRFVRILFVLVALFVSVIPFIGIVLLLPKVILYFHLRKKFLHAP